MPKECFSCSDRRGNGIHGESLSYSARTIVKRPSFVPRRRLAALSTRSETEALSNRRHSQIKEMGDIGECVS